MPDEVHLIKQRMEEKRADLADKIETLENTLMGTVQTTLLGASEVVNKVEQTFENVTGAVTGSVEESVAAVKETFNIRRQVDLLKQNLALFKVEMREDFRKTKEAAAALGVGAALAAVGGLHLTLMFVFLLALIPRIPLWVCFGIVGAVFVGFGLALIVRGKKKLESFNPRGMGSLRDER
jgi:hypothetical protein